MGEQVAAGLPLKVVRDTGNRKLCTLKIAYREKIQYLKHKEIQDIREKRFVTHKQNQDQRLQRYAGGTYESM